MKLEEAKVLAKNLAAQSVACLKRLDAIPLKPGEVILEGKDNAAAGKALQEAKLLCELGTSLTTCGLEIQARLWGKEEPRRG